MESTDWRKKARPAGLGWAAAGFYPTVCFDSQGPQGYYLAILVIK